MNTTTRTFLPAAVTEPIRSVAGITARTVRRVVDAILARGKRAPRPVNLLHSPAPSDHELPRPSGHIPSDGPVDRVTQAGMESFPASDPPAHGS